MKQAYLIVESKNDKFAFEAILRRMGIAGQVIVDAADLFDWREQPAEGNLEKPTELVNTFSSTLGEISNGKYKTVGIIWDLDEFTPEQRQAQINLALQKAIEKHNSLDSSNVASISGQASASAFASIKVGKAEAQFACFFVGLNGRGEMEDILKSVAKNPAPLADCVNACLPKCLSELETSSFREKDLVKLWVENYVRYDVLPKKERNDKFTSKEKVMLASPRFFDFDRSDVPDLQAIKAFLQMLVSSI